MKFISQSEFARSCKVSPNAIANAISKGDLTAHKQGERVYLDLTDPKTRAYKRLHTQKSKPGNGRADRQDNGGSNALTTLSPGLRAKIKGLLGADTTFEEFNEISEAFTNKLKTLQQIQDIKTRTDRARRKLIDRDLVAKMFGKIYTVDVNEFRMLGMNLAPELASIFNVDDPALVLAATERIDKEVYAILEHIKDILNGFLVEMELKEIIGDATNGIPN